MKLLVFYVAFAFLGASASIGHKLEQGFGAHLPLNPWPLRIVTGVATFATFGLFIWGFFPFSWWAPLLAIPVIAIAGGTLTVFGMRSGLPAGAAIWYALLGIGFAIGCLVVR